MGVLKLSTENMTKLMMAGGGGQLGSKHFSSLFSKRAPRWIIGRHWCVNVSWDRLEREDAPLGCERCRLGSRVHILSGSASLHAQVLQ